MGKTYNGNDKVDNFFAHYGRKGMKRGENIFNPNYKPIGEKAKGPSSQSEAQQRAFEASQRYAVDSRRQALLNGERNRQAAYANQQASNAAAKSAEVKNKKQEERQLLSEFRTALGDKVAYPDLEQRFSNAKSTYADWSKSERAKVAEALGLMLDTIITEDVKAGLYSESAGKHVLNQFKKDGSLNDTALMMAYYSEIYDTMNEAAGGQFNQMVGQVAQQQGTFIGADQKALQNFNYGNKGKLNASISAENEAARMHNQRKAANEESIRNRNNRIASKEKEKKRQLILEAERRRKSNYRG